MSPLDHSALERLERRIQELESRRASGMLRGACAVAAAVALPVLVAATPSHGLSAIESRVMALESMIGRAANGAPTVQAPFQVVDRAGKVMFSVSDDVARGAVSVHRNSAVPGTVVSAVNDAGREAATLGSWREGGRVLVLGASDDRHTLIGEGGLNVLNQDRKPLITLVNASNRGRLTLRYNDLTPVELTSDTSGGGSLRLRSPDGKTAIGLLATRRTVALGNSSGTTVAEMTVHPGGHGLFQVWDGGRLPLALLGKSVERSAGILQISNGTTVINSMTADGSGDGYWQLNNSSGIPMLEAGVQDNGLGTIRAGPQFECIHKMSQGIQRLPDCIRGKK